MARGTARFAASLVAAFIFGGVGSVGAAGSAMQVEGRTSQPIGHYQLCQQYPGECRVRSAKPAPEAMTATLWSTVARVNAQVNATYKPMTDFEMWGKEEVWSFPVKAADCEDFVLEKRRRLIRMGLPAGNLLITVLRQSNGEGHAVLTLRTTGGDYILDNLDNRIRLWTNTNYTYLKRQSERDSGVWLSIGDGRADAVASVR